MFPFSLGNKLRNYADPKVVNYVAFTKQIGAGSSLSAATSGRDFRVVVLSDLHLLRRQHNPLEKSFGAAKRHFFFKDGYLDISFDKILRFALDNIAKKLQPDLIVFLGDITDTGSKEEWDLFLGFVGPHLEDPYCAPIFVLLGNHDVSIPDIDLRGVQRPFSLFSKEFRKQLVWKPHEILEKRLASYERAREINSIAVRRMREKGWVADWKETGNYFPIFLDTGRAKAVRAQCVLMDSNATAPRSVLTNALGGFGRGQREWLRNALVDRQSGSSHVSHLVVLSHHHVAHSDYQYGGYPLGERLWEENIRSRWMAAKDSTKVVKLIRRCAASQYVSYIGGHRHFQYQGELRRYELFYGVNSLLFGDEAGHHMPSVFCLNCSYGVAPMAFWAQISGFEE